MNEKNKISNFKEGKELNIERIIKEYSNYLVKVIKNIGGNYLHAEDIEEIILDVFVVVWQKREILEEDKDIKPYLASITHNLTKKKLSGVNKVVQVITFEENVLNADDDLNEVIENILTFDKLEQILSNLSKEEYEIFSLFYYSSKRIKEISKILDISETNVKTQLHRIRNKLRKGLRESGYSI